MLRGTHLPNDDQVDPLPSGAVSRREFLRIAGIAGAVVATGGALGGSLAACSMGATTTTTSTSAPAPITTAGGSTTVSTAASTNREVKIGFVTPLTGSLAPYSVADRYCVRRAGEAIGPGLVCGDGQTHPVTIILRDSQSDAQHAAELTGQLITTDKVDMMVCASTPETVVPVADQCETLKVPCLSTECPWEAFIVSRSRGRVDAVFEWTYNVSWGAEDQIADFIDLWTQVPTNKKVGAMFPDDNDGNFLREVWNKRWAPAGFTVVAESGFKDGTPDFTPQIQRFKDAGCEIGYGVFTAQDFTSFWKQAAQQHWTPKLPTYLKSSLLPQMIEPLGGSANNLCVEVWWSPTFPYRSPLLDQTCGDLAADFGAKENQQWTQALVHLLLFDWAADVLKRAKSVDDKSAIMDAVKTTKIETIGGPIDFTARVEPPDEMLPPAEGRASFKIGPCHIVENVYKSPVAVGQWRKSTKRPFELTIVGNKACPTIPVAAKVRPYTGS
jgi:branched-chain amino acid transport system substrate-binding protein